MIKKILLGVLLPLLVILVSLSILIINLEAYYIFYRLIFIMMCFLAGFSVGDRYFQYNFAQRKEGIVANSFFNILSGYPIIWLEYNIIEGEWLAAVPLSVAILCSSGLVLCRNFLS